jgi:hypothetical protein
MIPTLISHNSPTTSDVTGNILLFFYKKKRKQNKKNNKLLPATSACCGAVVRNECRDHFSSFFSFPHFSLPHRTLLFFFFFFFLLFLLFLYLFLLSVHARHPTHFPSSFLFFPSLSPFISRTPIQNHP